MRTRMRELLFSVTAKDCDWQFERGTGKGGQKRNKTASAARCTHRDSGAVGYSDATRSQHRNKRIAFRKMSETKEFQKWSTIETARHTGRLLEVEESVDAAMAPENLKIETFKPTE